MKTKLLCLSSAVIAVLTQSAHAQETKTNPHVVLDKMNVRLVVPNNVEMLTKDKLKATQNIDDMFRDEAGVNVRSDNLQIGHQNIAIRGIDGNRVLMTIDGIPLPDEQQDLARGGAFVATASRDTVETDTLKSVQIIKGGNGTAQGDGSVGGSVNMRTYLPSDFVSDDKPLHFGVKYGYRSAYQSHGATATAAAKQGMASALVMLTGRSFHENDNYPADNAPTQGNNRTQSNKQDNRQQNILIKGSLDTDEHSLTATLERFSRNVKTELANEQGAGTINNQPSVTPISVAKDDYLRQRYDLTYRFAPKALAWLDGVSVRAYHQNTNVHNHKDVQSTIASTTEVDQESNNTYRQAVKGIRPEMFLVFQTGEMQHNLLVGSEYRQTQTSRLLNTTSERTVGGRTTTTTQNRAFFPPADRRVWSVYAQDNISFHQGAMLGLGLRYEREKTTFDFNNAHYLASVQNDPVKFDEMSNHIFLPSVGLTYPINDKITTSVAYRRGYRSPDVNFAASGFGNPTGGYRVIPNPKLKPESSDNYELGLQFNDEKLNVGASVFYAKYKDFINSYTQTTNVPAPYRLQIYFDNLDVARAYGAELKTAYQLTDHLRATGTLAWINTKNETTNEPLSTSYPLNGTLGLDYVAQSWNAGAKLNWATKNNHVPNDIVSRSGAVQRYFRAPAYAVLDLTAGYRLGKSTELTAGVYNVFDKKYWTAGDTKGVFDDAQKDRFTQAGRNFALGLEFEF